LKNASILVVEDERIVAEDLKQTLEDLGYTVPAVATTGAKAKECVSLFKPNLILMDIMIRGPVNGIDTTREILQTNDIPVVYLTAYADDATLARAKETCPYGYLVKPFSDRELCASIETALTRFDLERQIKVSERRLSTVLSTIAEAVIVTGVTGVIQFINPEAQRMTGWTDNLAIGKPIDEVVNLREADESEALASLFPTYVAGKMEIPLFAVIEAANGMITPIAANSRPMVDAAGAPQGYVLSLRDTTMRRRLEAELHRTQKLESLGVLAGGIAHDFNNILTAVLGNVSLARLNTDENTELYEILEEAENATARARTLTKQLLTFSRGGAPIRSSIEFPSLIKDCVDFALRGSIIAPVFDFADDVWPVMLDPGQMGQVIDNLVINAAQAMPSGGTITISAFNEIIEAKDETKLPEGNYVRLTLADQGAGIPEDIADKVFDPYFTTKAKGSGLGLATSYSIVKHHHGLISFSANSDGGTTFSILLPKADEAPDLKQTPVHPAPISGCKVLVMDDEQPILDIARPLLDHLGYESHLVTNCDDAVSACKEAIEEGAPFELALLDLTIPGGKGGRETVKELQKIDPSLKAILVSGYFDDPLITDCEEAGFCSVLAKPYKLAELQHSLHCARTCDELAEDAPQQTS